MLYQNKRALPLEHTVRHHQMQGKANLAVQLLKYLHCEKSTDRGCAGRRAYIEGSKHKALNEMPVELLHLGHAVMETEEQLYKQPLLHPRQQNAMRNETKKVHFQSKTWRLLVR
eukprot:scpid41131/ scgid30191/ 